MKPETMKPKETMKSKDEWNITKFTQSKQIHVQRPQQKH